MQRCRLKNAGNWRYPAITLAEEKKETGAWRLTLLGEDGERREKQEDDNREKKLQKRNYKMNLAMLAPP